MEWQFRKTLQTFDSYKKSNQFKAEIQKGNENVLKVVVREVQLIISDSKEQIRSKVLAMRFIKDIMVLGRQDVVESVQKLIPHILKICSFQLQSDDPNRGQTFFHQHPSYLKSSEQEHRNQIDQLGSTYLILSLESILHWAKWIPLDQSGKQSIYFKAYQDLLQRGVAFPTTFHYYKQSDTQKFKNTYKMQFFTDSYYSEYTSMSATQNNVSMKASKKQNLTQLANSQIFQKTSITTIGQIQKYIQQLRQSGQFTPTTNRRLEAIHKKLQQMYSIQYSDKNLYKNKNLKQQKKWVDNYLINYGFYTNKAIDFKEFLKKTNSQELQLQNKQDQQSLSVLGNNANNQSIKMNKSIPLNSGQNTRMLKSPKKQLGKAVSSSQQLLKKQQYEYNAKILQLSNKLQIKDQEIQRLTELFQRQKREIIVDYQKRMEFLKAQIVRPQKQKNKPMLIQLQFQNQQLKKKIQLIQNQLINTHTVKQQELQIERNKLFKDVQKLKIQNQKLVQIINQKNQHEYKLKVQTKQSFSSKNGTGNDFGNKQNIVKFQNQIKQLEDQLEEKNILIKKIQKSHRKVEDQLNLYKGQLVTQRGKQDNKVLTYVKKVEYYQSQNKTLKERLLQAKRTIDIKDVQLMDAKQDLRRYQTKLKDMNQKKGTWSEAQSVRTSRQNNQYQSPDRLGSPNRKDPFQQLVSNKKIKFNNYQDLFTQLKPANKQVFLRLCRSSFKKKDILFKQNQFQVGIITEVLSQNKLSFLLHLTNVAEKQIQNITIEPLVAQGLFISTLDYELDLKYIFCIQPQEQQKVYIAITNKESPLIKDRAIITIQYEKSGVSYSHNIFLPFTIPKFLSCLKPSKQFSNGKNYKEQLYLRYSKKMFPKASYLKNYFQNIQEVIVDKKYEVELYNRQTDLSMLATFMFGQGQTINIEVVASRQKLNQKQKYIMEETLSFFQIAFRK